MASSSDFSTTPHVPGHSGLRWIAFTTGQSTANDDNAPTAPSGVLGGGFDPLRLHHLADVKGLLEYLALGDDKINDLLGASGALSSRGWSDDFCYGTGTTYLSGEHSVKY